MKALISVGFGSLVILFFSNSLHAECVLIVNTSVPEVSLKKNDIKQIYLGKKKKWSNGQWVHPVVLRKGNVRNEFLNKYVEKTASNYYSFWRKKIVSGTGIPPKSFQFDSGVIEFVSQKKGAIGYISSKDIIEGVRIIHVETTDTEDISKENELSPQN